MTPPTVRVMFLGGTLDHTVRHVPRDEINPERPAADLIAAPLHTAQWRRLGPRDVAETPVQDYDLQKVESGHRSWWCFVLRGYAPPRRHLLDANPNPI